MARKRNEKKIRTDFRKNRESRTRRQDWTGKYRRDDLDQDSVTSSERVSGKGEITRRRTVIGAETENDETGLAVLRVVNEEKCLPGCVVSMHGLASNVLADDGHVYRCATRRLLKTLVTSLRHVVAVGDRVLIRPAGNDEGIIERVEPRHGVLSRTSRGRQHVIVANVDQLLIIASAAEPDVKPNLIDRMLVATETSSIKPIICVNKIDLVDRAKLQPLVGVYGQLGYRVLLLSATTGFGIDRLRQQIEQRQSAVVGQSGVGKSSLLNVVQPGLGLRVREISAENEKGRHTTTAAVLIALERGGYIVDTPGIRQFGLWNVIPEELAACYRDIRPYVSHCRFPNCSHTHEADCAVKDAVADGLIDMRRYDSFCQIYAADEPEL